MESRRTSQTPEEAAEQLAAAGVPLSTHPEVLADQLANPENWIEKEEPSPPAPNVPILSGAFTDYGVEVTITLPWAYIMDVRTPQEPEPAETPQPPAELAHLYEGETDPAYQWPNPPRGELPH